MADALSAEDRVALVRAVYEGVAAGDPMPFVNLLHPDVTWHFPGTSWMGGDFHGAPAVLQLFADIARMTGGTFSPVPRHVVGDDEVVVSVVEATASFGGRTLATPVCVVWRFEGDKVVDGREHIFDVAGLDALWGDARP